MKVIIAGSRDIADMSKVEAAIRHSKFKITEVVGGGCSGVDRLGWRWAVDNKIPFTLFKANWNRYGKYAGPIRNREMACYADALIAVWDGKSRGTRSMLNEAAEKGLKVYLARVKELNTCLV